MGNEEARKFLDRLIEPRNILYHANAISVRDAERIVCYSNDVVESIKAHYAAIDVNEKFPVPKIIKVTDNFGKAFFREQIVKAEGQAFSVHPQNDSKQELRSGDVISLEIEVDPSHDSDSYEIEWRYGGALHSSTDQRRLVIQLDDSNVGVGFLVLCSIKCKRQSWHKHGDHDDRLSVAYRVLPRIC